jgi:hypothetical protein
MISGKKKIKIKYQETGKKIKNDLESNLEPTLRCPSAFALCCPTRILALAGGMLSSAIKTHQIHDREGKWSSRPWM